MGSSSSPERVLQEELKDAGNRLLMPPSSTDELLSLLDKVEHLVSRVDQAPSRSMQDALLPAMKAVIAQELLRHSDTDVKVSVASCINEITRVTAPDAPYDDEKMKEIFKLSVMALEKLSLASGRCYTKALSILDTMAKVRSCLVMLDLECDELIVEMFHLFINTIRSDHPNCVFLEMEAIMTLVIEEIEEISLELLIPLLSCVKKENQIISPLASELGESVLRNCAATLKPYLPRAVQLMRLNLNDMAGIVNSICQDGSEREHSQVSKEVAVDAVCSKGAAGPCIGGIARPAMTDSTVQMRRTATSWDGKSLRMLEHCQNKSTDARSKANRAYLDSIKTGNHETEPESGPKRRGRKPNSLVKPEEGYDRSWLGEGRKASELRHGKNHEKKFGSSLSDSRAKEAARSTSGKESKSHVFSLQTSQGENINASPSKSHSFPDGNHNKRGRPKRKVLVMNQDGDPEGNKESSTAQIDGKNQSRGITFSGKPATNESIRKKIVSFSAADSFNKDERQSEEASRTRCKRKRTPREEEVSEMPHDFENHGEEVVGCGIKVWWPLDQMYYEGAISSFDPVAKKHTVLYADGDEEILDLSKERWILVGKNNLPEQGQEIRNLPSLDILSDMPQKKRVKTKLESSPKQENIVSSSSKSGGGAGASGDKSLLESPKCGRKSTYSSTLDTFCLDDEAKGDSSKTVDNLKDEAQKSDDKLKPSTQKAPNGVNSQIDGESNSVDFAKPKNILSEEVLNLDARKQKLSHSIDTQGREETIGKKQHRCDER